MPSQKYTIDEFKMRMKANKTQRKKCELCGKLPFVTNMNIKQEDGSKITMKICRTCKTEYLAQARATMKKTTRR